jgi:hypothetical protein
LNLSSHIKAGDEKIIEAEEKEIWDSIFNIKPPMWHERKEGEGYVKVTEYYDPPPTKYTIVEHNPCNNSFTVMDEQGNLKTHYGY